MASGQTLVTLYPSDNEPPTSNYATPDRRNTHPTLDFDASTDEEAVFTFVMPRNYGGGGVTVYLHWSATSATSGACRWQTAFEADVSQDIDSDGFASFNSGGDTAPGTSGVPKVTSIAHTNGGQMDSIAAGELGRLKVRRDADGTTGTDDMTGDAELLAIEIKET